MVFGKRPRLDIRQGGDNDKKMYYLMIIEVV